MTFFARGKIEVMLWRKKLVGENEVKLHAEPEVSQPVNEAVPEEQSDVKNEFVTEDQAEPTHEDQPAETLAENADTVETEDVATEDAVQEPNESDAAEPKRRFIPKAVRNALISAAVLLVVLVAGGVAYTYYEGQNTTENTAAIAVAAAPQPVQPIKPRKPAANAPESAAVEMMSSPVKPGEDASIAVKTNPGSKCTITVLYNKVPSTEPGLIPQVADEFGTVNWGWTISASAPIGTWPVKVTCTYNGRSGVVVDNLQVAK